MSLTAYQLPPSPPDRPGACARPAAYGYRSPVEARVSVAAAAHRGYALMVDEQCRCGRWHLRARIEGPTHMHGEGRPPDATEGPVPALP